MRDLSKGLPSDYTEEEFSAYSMAVYQREQQAKRQSVGVLVCQACAGDAPGGKCQTKGCYGGPIVEEVPADVETPFQPDQKGGA
jgi:hypothetical protein